MDIQKITIYSVSGSRNAGLEGTTGYIVNMLKNQQTGLPVYMVRTVLGNIAPISEGFETFVIWGRCGNCDEEVDVRTLTDDYYEECLECVAWFQNRMNLAPKSDSKADTVTTTLAKIALTNKKKKGKTYGKL
jgi:hypothetical protein